MTIDTCPTCARRHRAEQPCLRGVLLVCGGRDFDNWFTVCETLDRMTERMEIVAVRHGNARGADSLAHRWALATGHLPDPVPADWSTHGRRAGLIRNAEMLARIPIPVACVAFAGSRGTADMVAKCEAAGVPVWRAGGWT